mmetsp:Transcript_20821/g.54283  ORF Transcript_20821/g.54283 Transcript_20821/m.54283 type:complete len:206 (+) Transcript_20821:1075-1692(+)
MSSTNVHTHARTHTYTHVHTRALARTHIHTHTKAHTHTHAHAHAHTSSWKILSASRSLMAFSCTAQVCGCRCAFMGLPEVSTSALVCSASTSSCVPTQGSSSSQKLERIDRSTTRRVMFAKPRPTQLLGPAEKGTMLAVADSAWPAYVACLLKGQEVLPLAGRLLKSPSAFIQRSGSNFSGSVKLIAEFCTLWIGTHSFSPFRMK